MDVSIVTIMLIGEGGILQIKKNSYFCRELAGVAQLVEHDLAKVGVAGSSPVSRSKKAATIYRGGFFVYEGRGHACMEEDRGNPVSSTRSGVDGIICTQAMDGTMAIGIK